MIPGMSKTTRPTMKTNSEAERIAGIMIGRTTVRISVQVPAPEVKAASSKLGSIFLKAGESMRKVVGTRANPCTKIIPGRLYMFMGAFSKLNKPIRRVLKNPILGLKRRTQLTAKMMGGMAIVEIMTPLSRDLKGVSVLSKSHAKVAPRSKAMIALPTENWRLFQKSLYV
jgi:hypothetical protein